MTLRAFFYVAMGIQFTNFAFSTKYDGHLTFTHFCTCLNRFHVGVELNIYEQLQNQSIMLVLNITSQICMSCKQSFSIRCRMRGGREYAQNTNSSLSCTNLHLQNDSATGAVIQMNSGGDGPPFFLCLIGSLSSVDCRSCQSSFQSDGGFSANHAMMRSGAGGDEISKCERWFGIQQLEMEWGVKLTKVG